MTDNAPEFNWVHARAACSAAKMFEQLRAHVVRDVEIRNKINEGGGYKFDTHSEHAGITVFLDSMFHQQNPYRVVRFLVEDEHIIARYGNDAIIWSATLTLNDKGQCRLKIDNKEYELWQACYMGLEKLFFDIIRPF